MPYQPLDIQVSTFWLAEDVRWMREAIEFAKQGAERGEVPVGAVLVHDQQIIGQGFNQPISSHDATAHAEIVALRDACTRLENYRLPLQTTLYVTLEPCTMCIGALIHARVNKLVYAASIVAKYSRRFFVSVGKRQKRITPLCKLKILINKISVLVLVVTMIFCYNTALFDSTHFNGLLKT